MQVFDSCSPLQILDALDRAELIEGELADAVTLDIRIGDLGEVQIVNDSVRKLVRLPMPDDVKTTWGMPPCSSRWPIARAKLALDRLGSAWAEAVDQHGFPLQQDGASLAVPGLYFVGVHFLRTRKSSLLYGVGEDAAIVASAVSTQIGR